MKLSTTEITELKKQKPCKVWRLTEPPAAEAGKSYRAGDEDYTVLAVETLSGGDVLRRFGKSEYEKLRSEYIPEWERLWLVVVVAGDRTDKPNLLAYAGFGDAHGYSDRQRKTKTGRPTVMTDEPEAISRVEAQKMAKAVEAVSELKREEKRKKRRLPKRLRPYATSGVGWPD